jgi:G3E family GTPase
MTAGAASERIPVSLVTGFLGSGKTTLISALLKQPSMAGTAVVVNEFGAVGIDDAIFAETGDAGDVVLLANGCLCCAAGDDLAQTIWVLARRARPPRRIVIETSGLADPAPSLLRLMSDARLRQAIRLDGLVATIDAVNGLANLAKQPVAQRQCAVADRRVITKTDLAGSGAAQSLAERLIVLNPGAPVFFADHGAIEADRLFGGGLFDSSNSHADVDRWLGLNGYRGLPRSRPERPIVCSGGPAHDPTVGSWLIEESCPVDWAILSPLFGDVIARHGGELLRLKGVIQTSGDSRPLVIHGVQRVFHAPVRLQRWMRDPATSIVVIGGKGARPAVDLISEALGRSAIGKPIERNLAAASPEI